MADTTDRTARHTTSTYKHNSGLLRAEYMNACKQDGLTGFLTKRRKRDDHAIPGETLSQNMTVGNFKRSLMTSLLQQMPHTFFPVQWAIYSLLFCLLMLSYRLHRSDKYACIKAFDRKEGEESTAAMW